MLERKHAIICWRVIAFDDDDVRQEKGFCPYATAAGQPVVTTISQQADAADDYASRQDNRPRPIFSFIGFIFKSPQSAHIIDFLISAAFGWLACGHFTPGYASRRRKSRPPST